MKVLIQNATPFTVLVVSRAWSMKSYPLCSGDPCYAPRLMRVILDTTSRDPLAQSLSNNRI